MCSISLFTDMLIVANSSFGNCICWQSFSIVITILPRYAIVTAYIHSKCEHYSSAPALYQTKLKHFQYEFIRNASFLRSTHTFNIRIDTQSKFESIYLAGLMISLFFLSAFKLMILIYINEMMQLLQISEVPLMNILNLMGFIQNDWKLIMIMHAIRRDEIE